MEGKTIRLLDRTRLEPGCSGEGTGYTVWHAWPEQFTQGWLRVVVEEGEANDRILLEPQVSADRTSVVALEAVRSTPASVTRTLVHGIRGPSLRARVAFALRRPTRVTADITPVSE